MSSNARLRLYQYPCEYRCAAILLLLQQSEVPYEVVNLHYCEPSPVIQLTQGNFFHVPLLEDLLMAQAIWEQGEGTQDVAHHIDTIAQMHLFPEKSRGLQQVLTHFIEKECGELATKICDAFYDRWVESDWERGLLRRARSLQYGPEALRQWGKDMDVLLEKWNHRVRPLNHRLGETAFLLGDQVRYVDYALYGVLKNFLHCQATHLSTEFVHLGHWFEKMQAGQFPRGKVGAKKGEGVAAIPSQDSSEAATSGAAFLTDLQDFSTAFEELRVGAGRRALDYGCGLGQPGVFLAERGLNVSLCALEERSLGQAMSLAAEKNLQLESQVSSAETLPYPEGQFDLVVCYRMAHHIARPDTFLSEANRILRWYGHVVMIDLVSPDDHPEVGQWVNEFEKIVDPTHYRLTRPNDWRKWCQPLGLKVVKDQQEMFPIPDIEAYFTFYGVSEESRQLLVEKVARAPGPVRELLKITQEGAKTSLCLPKFILVAGKI